MSRHLSFRKGIAVLLILAITLLTALSAVGAEPAGSISVQKYNPVTKQYEPCADGQASTGDLIRLQLSFNTQLTTLSAMSIKLSYDGSAVRYVDGTAFAALSQGKPLTADSYHSETPENSYIKTVWNMDTAVENFQGQVVSYVFRCENANAAAGFTFKVEEIYDGAYGSVTTYSNKRYSTDISISQWSLDAAPLQVFQDLNAWYTDPDAVADEAAQQLIDAAKTEYAKFAEDTQNRFGNQYPQLQTAYQNAQARYYDLLESYLASNPEALVGQRFLEKETTQKILALETPGVNENNYKEVIKVFEEYAALSADAKTVVGAENAAKLSSLKEAADAVAQRLADAVAEQKRQDAEDALQFMIEFYAQYGIWEASDDDVRASAEVTAFLDNLNAAKADYAALDIASMSPQKQAEAKTYGDRIAHMENLVAQELADLEKERAAEVEINLFNTRWNKITRLNAFTVGVEHISALELMIADAKNLSPLAQESLTPQLKKAEQLLEIAKELAEEPGETVVVPGETVVIPGETVVVPGETVVVPGETVTVPGETVVIPGETVKVPGETVTVPAETVVVPGQTVQVPGETVVVPGETVTVPGETVTEVVTQTQVKEVPFVVRFLVTLMIVCVLSAAIPITYELIYRKKHKKEER